MYDAENDDEVGLGGLFGRKKKKRKHHAPKHRKPARPLARPVSRSQFDPLTQGAAPLDVAAPPVEVNMLAPDGSIPGASEDAPESAAPAPDKSKLLLLVGAAGLAYLLFGRKS